MPDRNNRFHHFAAIDWSGAVGERHKGIAIAICGRGFAAPALVRPGHRWSRLDALLWVGREMPRETLVGLDFGLSLPFADRGAFFPGWMQSPPDARALWAMVEQICRDDAHLSVSSFVDHPEAARHYRRHGGRLGDRFGAPGETGGRGRFRVTEHAQVTLGCRPYSNFNLIGAAQVGKSSLAGMRFLHRLDRRLPIWPIDPLPEQGSVVTEIYTTIAAVEAKRKPGRSKMRTIAELNDALDAYDTAPLPGAGVIDDHSSDALLTAAWLRARATRAELWDPEQMTPLIAATEGWTFGAP